MSTTTFIRSNQLSDSSTGVSLMFGVSRTASHSKFGPTIARSIARNKSTIRNVANGPAAATLNSSAGERASRDIWVKPPNRNNWMLLTSIPCRLATIAWPSS